MFDFKRAEKPAGWVSEMEACRKWFDSCFKEVDADMVESFENDRFLKCLDLPAKGTSISSYGEFGLNEPFPYYVSGIDLDREVIKAEAKNGTALEIPIEDLKNQEGGPDQNELWILDEKPTPHEIKEFNDCGVSVYKDDEDNYYLGIDGYGYDPYETHWIKLYRAYGICMHSTEDDWLDELRHRVSSYVEMCADIPKDLTRSNRRNLMKELVDATLDPNRIERITKQHLQCLRVHRFFKRTSSMLAGDRPKSKHLGREHHVSSCD